MDTEQPAVDEGMPRPRGRAAVRLAILEAAADLMAQHGAAASLRDIAAAAGVNLGLIHRHFGNKADLRSAVLVHLGESQRQRLDAREGQPSFAELFSAVQQDDRSWRILMHAIMSDEKISTVQHRFPVVERIVQLMNEVAGPDADPNEVRYAVGRLIATSLGWLMVEPFIVESLGINQPVEQLRDRLISELTSELGLPE